MKKTRIVVVGYGRMGKAQVRVMRETLGLEVIAAVDPKAVAGPELGSIPLVKNLSDLDPMSFEAAVVATPTALHFQTASELVAMGKHLLVEKPITSTFAQARELLAAAHQKKLRLAVGHVERFNPAVRKLREIIKEGWLGTPIHFSFTRVGGYPDTLITGNNVMLDLAVHDIDVLRCLVGPVKLINSMCHAIWKPGVVDTAEIFLAAQSGPSASMHVNWVTPTKIRSIRVTGTRGVCFIDYVLQTCELMGGHLLPSVEPTSTSYASFQDLYRATDRIQFGVVKVEPLRAQAEALHHYLTSGEIGELATGNDAAAAVLIAERAVQTDSILRGPPSVAPPAALADTLVTTDTEWV
jgi:UDP-N-acetylglucosamine 3-dehydrogenase